MFEDGGPPMPMTKGAPLVLALSNASSNTYRDVMNAQGLSPPLLLVGLQTLSLQHFERAGNREDSGVR